MPPEKLLPSLVLIDVARFAFSHGRSSESRALRSSSRDRQRSHGDQWGVRCRQLDHEFEPVVVSLDIHASVLVVDQPLGQRQHQSAGNVTITEWLEEICRQVLFNRLREDPRDCNGVSTRARAQLHRTMWCQSRRTEQQLDEGPLNLVRVCGNRHWLRAHHDIDRFRTTLGKGGVTSRAALRARSFRSTD